MRPIDADALYDRLSSFTGMFTDEIDFAVNLYQVLACIDVAPTIEQPTWISVEDRLPTEKVNCIVYCKHAYNDNDGYWAIDVCFYDGVEFKVNLAYKVTHWMTLPEPPKGG